MPRLALDAYETPSHYIAALFGEVNIFGRVFEPCAGDGDIARAVEKLPAVKSVWTNDIDPARDTTTHYDSTTEVPAASFDWVVSNPPFSEELAIVQMMQGFEVPIAMLARLSFLEPAEAREEFLEQNPPNQILVLPRYSFRPNDEGKRQTDSVTCAWLVWYPDGQPRHTKVWGRRKATVEALVRGL